MNSDQLKTFMKIASLGSFSKAAESEFCTKQAIVKRINELEKELDCRLVERTSQGTSLTEAGNEFLSFLNDIEKSFSETMFKIHRKQNSLLYGVDNQHVYPEDYIIIGFLQSHGYSVRLIPCPRNDIFEMLDDGRINVALLPMFSKLKDKYFMYKILDLPLTIVSGHYLKPNTKLEELADMDIYIDGFGSDQMQSITEKLEANNSRIHPINSIVDLYVLSSYPSAVVMGLGYRQDTIPSNLYYSVVTEDKIGMYLYLEKDLPISQRIIDSIVEKCSDSENK